VLTRTPYLDLRKLRKMEGKEGREEPIPSQKIDYGVGNSISCGCYATAVYSATM